MRYLFLLILLLYPQAQTLVVSIPVKDTAFDIGYGSTLRQNLGVTPAQLQEFAPGYTKDGVYLLTFDVVNYFPSYPGYYDVKVSFGTQELCEGAGWGTKAVMRITVVCPGPGYIVVDRMLPGDNPGQPGPVQGNQDLVLTFTVYDWQLLISNVSMTFTKEAE